MNALSGGSRLNECHVVLLSETTVPDDGKGIIRRL